MLLIKEFAARVGLTRLVKKLFKTNDHTARRHTDPDNLMQIIYQIIAAYFEDDCADELTNDPVLTAILGKEKLASQPTLSRFWNRMDEDTLSQLEAITERMRELVYSVQNPTSCFKRSSRFSSSDIFCSISHTRSSVFTNAASVGRFGL